VHYPLRTSTFNWGLSDCSYWERLHWHWRFNDAAKRHIFSLSLIMAGPY